MTPLSSPAHFGLQTRRRDLLREVLMESLQQHISPIGFLFRNFRHRLVRYYWYVLLLELFFSTNTCGSNPRTVTNPKTTRVFIPPSWTLSRSRNSKRASLLISSWSNHWVTSGNRKLKNLGPEAMGWIDDGSLMVVDGRFCRIFSHGRSWKSRIFGWPLVSLLSPMEVLPVICQQKAFLPNEAGLGHELVT